eukprot:m.90332 g.90332  ORF g.90332 m.90332 type:complete len:256 (+) comp14876_c0_seq1:91-858(+)
MSDLDWDADEFDVEAVEVAEEAPQAEEIIADEPVQQQSKAPAKYAEMSREELLAEIAELVKNQPTKQSNKKKLKAKLRQKEEEEQRRAAEEQAAAAEANLTKEEIAAARLAERRQIDEANFQAAVDFIADDEEEEVVLIEAMQPKSADDFVKFRTAIARKACKYDKAPHYKSFVELLARDLCEGLDSETIRSVTKSMNVLANDKAKTERSKKGKAKPKKKAQLSSGKGAAASMKGFMDGEGGGYDDLIDDELDFM